MAGGYTKFSLLDFFDFTVHSVLGFRRFSKTQARDIDV
jgi:hypothetical protein